MPKITVKGGIGKRGFNMYGDGFPGRYIEIHPDNPVEVSEKELEFLNKFAGGQFEIITEEKSSDAEGGTNGKDNGKKRKDNSNRGASHKHSQLDD